VTEHAAGPAPITATVKEFCRISGLGKTKVFEMIADKSLDTVKFGTRRLVILASYERLIAAQVRSGSSEAGS
jgi:excisionase family DNA binding protein